MSKVDTMYIIDDDEIFQFLTQRIIEKSNLVNQIKLFSNGNEAIEFLKKVRETPGLLPEVILLDLTMPIMDGWEFLEEYILLKPELTKEITIYIVSSSINPDDIERAKNINEVTDFIVKPITMDRLLAMMKSL